MVLHIVSGYLRPQYKKCKDASLALLADCPKLQSFVKDEFHGLFTFSLVVGFELLYLLWLMSGGPLSEQNLFKRLFVHIHLALMLVGGAALRCLAGYMIAGDHMPEGGTFDYPKDKSAGDAPAHVKASPPAKAKASSPVEKSGSSDGPSKPKSE